MMMKEALENKEEGIRVGGELIKDVKYADDQGMVSCMNEKRSLIKTIWDRKKNWIGHVVRGDGLMNWC